MRKLIINYEMGKRFDSQIKIYDLVDLKNVKYFTKSRASLAYTRNVKDDVRRVSREHRDVVTSNKICKVVFVIFFSRASFL